MSSLPTNCDNCAHDYKQGRARMCRRIDAIYATQEDNDELFEWVADNVDSLGAPTPDSTGCPGYSARVPS